MSEHTKEPWATDYRKRENETCAQEIFDITTGETIAIMTWYPVRNGRVTSTNRQENARRIVACVNACARLSTEAIEQAGQLQIPVKKLTSDTEISEIRQQLAELLAIIKKSACDGANCHSCANPCDKYLEELR